MGGFYERFLIRAGCGEAVPFFFLISFRISTKTRELLKCDSNSLTSAVHFVCLFFLFDVLLHKPPVKEKADSRGWTCHLVSLEFSQWDSQPVRRAT